MSLMVYGYHGDVDRHFREDAPRPPVPGEEDRQVVQAKDNGQFSRRTPPRRSDLSLGFELEGSASWDEPWAETLLALLDDRDGTMLFHHFLRGRGCCELLDFWFACSGFRKFPAGAMERQHKLAKAMYRCYLSERSRSVVSRRVATVTRCGVLDSIRRSQVDSSLFAQAHAQVQAVLEQELFPLFLGSDEYLKHGQEVLTKPPSTTDQHHLHNTALPAQLTTPSPEKGAGPETEDLPSYNTANQKSKYNRKSSQRRHTCHQHTRTTGEREKTHAHLPHTPVKMRTHTFMSELMRRLQELQTQSLVAKEKDDVTDRISLEMRESPTHSLCYYDTDDINTCEVKCVRSPLHTQTHCTDDLDCVQTHTQHYGSAGESVTVVYYLCGEVIPYRTCVQTNSVTLAHFKSLLTRRGSYRYFFKRASSEFECGVVYEEVREDDTVLPTYEHKIIAKVERTNS